MTASTLETGQIAWTEFTESTPLLSDPEALRVRAASDGYLFFRGLLPPADLEPLRRDMLAIVHGHGWTHAPDSEIIDLDALNSVPESCMRTDIGVTHEAYHQVQKLQSLHRLPHHPALINLYEALFGGPVLVHPRHIARMITGHNSMTPTPPHQDFPLIQGASHTWTCWFPLSDCPPERGSLMALRGSHHAGYMPIRPAPGAGGITAQLCPAETDWVGGGFRAGDVLTFNSLTVHSALPCAARDHIRLSLDVRYQSVAEPVEAKSLLPHCPLTWEQIYADWQSDDLKYYWRSLPLRISPWDPALLQPGRRIC